MWVEVHPKVMKPVPRGRKLQWETCKRAQLVIIVSDTSRIYDQGVKVVLNSLAAVYPIHFLKYLQLPHSLTLCVLHCFTFVTRNSCPSGCFCLQSLCSLWFSVSELIEIIVQLCKCGLESPILPSFLQVNHHSDHVGSLGMLYNAWVTGGNFLSDV